MSAPIITIGCHAYRELPLHPEHMTQEQFDMFAARRPEGMSAELAKKLMTCAAISIAPRHGRYWNIVLMGQVLDRLGWR